MSEWPSTCVWILGYSEPLCAVGKGGVKGGNIVRVGGETQAVREFFWSFVYASSQDNVSVHPSVTIKDLR